MSCNHVFASPILPHQLAKGLDLRRALPLLLLYMILVTVRSLLLLLFFQSHPGFPFAVGQRVAWPSLRAV
jgi:hypothetical protein